MDVQRTDDHYSSQHSIAFEVILYSSVEPVAREKKASQVFMSYKVAVFPAPGLIGGGFDLIWPSWVKRSCSSTRQGGLFVCHGPSSSVGCCCHVAGSFLMTQLWRQRFIPRQRQGLFMSRRQRPVGRPSVHSPAADHRTAGWSFYIAFTLCNLRSILKRIFFTKFLKVFVDFRKRKYFFEFFFTSPFRVLFKFYFLFFA